MIDTHFSDRVASKGITDQKSSGRCWLFTGLNVLRAQMKERMLGEIWRMLVLCLGEPPVKFEWSRCGKDGEIVETREYTPKEFYDEYIGNDLRSGYVMLMNDPCREYHKVYEIQYDRHCYDGQNWKYLNLPSDELKEIAIASIKADRTMYVSCDVSKFFNRAKGTLDIRNFDYDSLMGVEFGMDE